MSASTTARRSPPRTWSSASRAPRPSFPSGFAGRIESIAEVRAVDEHTVRIETKFPDPRLWEKVRHIAIMSEALGGGP